MTAFSFPMFLCEPKGRVTWYVVLTHGLYSVKCYTAVCLVLFIRREKKMPGEKAVCVLLPNDSSVKGTIHFEQVSREF